MVVRLDWKYALHLPLTYAGFDCSCLCSFRRRLLAHAQERLVFATLLGKIRALGFLKQRGTQRTDSLAVLGAVAQLSVLALARETLRLAVRALGEAEAAWSGQALPASFREEYAQRQGEYRLSAQERVAALGQVGADGYWLLDLPAVATLRTVWAQRFVRAAGQVQVRDDAVPATAR